MKRDIHLERVYPHPPERVWGAIATSDALAKWCMPNDFQPRVGHKFTFRTKPSPGFDGVVHCEVLEVREPSRLSFAWSNANLHTVLTFQLEPLDQGRSTRLVLSHTGFEGLRSIGVSFILQTGWGRMLDRRLPPVIAGTGAEPCESNCQPAASKLN